MVCDESWTSLFRKGLGSFTILRVAINDEIKWKCVVFGMYLKGERRKQKGTKKTKTSSIM